jgi:putative membrane protein
MTYVIMRTGAAALVFFGATAAAPAPIGAMPAMPMCVAAAVQTSAAPDRSAQAGPRDAARYVAAAGASDLYEIQSSQLAQQKAASDGVRRFAAMMIEHHTMTTQQVTAAAHAAGLTPPPPALEPQQAAMIQRLQGLSGAAFDAEYLRQQRLAHDMALKLHTRYAADGDTPALRETATKAVPIIRQHIAQLSAMPRR